MIDFKKHLDDILKEKKSKTEECTLNENYFSIQYLLDKNVQNV